MPRQWIKGRVYEGHCDLSPSGRRFIYHVETDRGPAPGMDRYQPSRRTFAALCLWAGGGAWGGGGMFDSENRVRLNHGSEGTRPAPDFGLPRALDVRSMTSGRIPRGNGRCIWPCRNATAGRGGRSSSGNSSRMARGGTLQVAQPEIRQKSRGDFILEARIVAYARPGEPHYIRESRSTITEQPSVIWDAAIARTGPMTFGCCRHVRGGFSISRFRIRHGPGRCTAS